MEQEPKPTISDVARTIAEGSPNDWISDALAFFCEMFADTRAGLDVHGPVEAMRDAVDTLLKWLPIFENLPLGMQSPDASAALAILPRIRELLDPIGPKKRGRPLDVRKIICASVMIEICTIVHKNAPARSERLQDACDMYWRAGGGEAIGGYDAPGNWRRPLARALKQERAWIRKIIEAHRDFAAGT